MTELPFTVDEFLAVFAAYNRALIIGAAGLWCVAIVVLIGGARRPRRASRALSLFLAALWGWNAVAYHALFFTSINPAAWLFARAFLLQTFLFAATYRNIEYFSATGLREATGVALVVYALAYPFLTIASGHTYPATPTFGGALSNGHPDHRCADDCSCRPPDLAGHHPHTLGVHRRVGRDTAWGADGLRPPGGGSHV